MARTGRFLLTAAAIFGIQALPLVLPAPQASAAATGDGETWRASISSTGQQGALGSTRARISQDGRHVAYLTKSQLVLGDTDLLDIYWTDLTDPSHPITKRVSTSSTGGGANGEAEFVDLNGDGSKVVYSTLATNALPGVGSGAFLRDMNNPNPATATKLIAEGGSRPVVSDDGRYVGYNTLNLTGIFAKDMATGRTLVVTPSAGSAGSEPDTFRPEISGDGKFLIFASDLQLAPNDTNNARDVYVADLRPWEAGSDAPPPLEVVSVGLNGQAAGFASRPGINKDGSVLAFQSSASNLVAGDTNGQLDAFVRDYRTNPAGVTYLVSYDVTGKVPPTSSERPQLDDSGNVVTFVSTAGKIVNGDTNGKEDSFIRNWFEERTTGPSTQTFLLAVSPTGESGVCPGIANTSEDTKAISTRPYISGDGKAVVFVSGDCNLTPDAAHGGPDTNLMSDIFVRRYGGGGQSFRGLPAPARLLDTRPGGHTADGQLAGTGQLAGGGVLQLPVAGRAGVPPGASSAVLNVTVTAPAGAGFVTVYPCGLPVPTASNLNFVGGQTVANAVASKLSADGKACLFTSATTHLIVDVGGYFPSTSVYTPLAVPARLADTRPGTPTVDGQFAGIGVRPAGGVLALNVAGRAGVPGGAASVVLNVTVTGPTAPGFVTVYACGQPVPTASNLNFVPGQTVPNAVVSRLSASGQVCLFTSQTTHLIVDAGGYFPTAVVYTPLATPARLMDTRPGAADGRRPVRRRRSAARRLRDAATRREPRRRAGYGGDSRAERHGHRCDRAWVRHGVPLRPAGARRLEPQLRRWRNGAERRGGERGHGRRGLPFHLGPNALARGRLRVAALRAAGRSGHRAERSWPAVGCQRRTG